MKQIILLTLLSLLMRPVLSQDRNKFDKFKTGKFIYDVKGNTAVIIRTKKKQTEIMNGGKSKVVMKIKWINDSTYILTCKKLINVPGCLGKSDWIKATIKRVNGNKYECYYTSEKCGDGTSVFVKIE